MVKRLVVISANYQRLNAGSRLARPAIGSGAIQGPVDLRVVILADTLAVEPTTAGRVVVESKAPAIVEVRSDPAKATWELQARA
jgi:hypothetical protein